MVFAVSENERSTHRGARTSHSLLSRALGKSLFPMAREHPRLVHQPSGLVGSPNTGLVPENSKPGCQNTKIWGYLGRHRSTERFGELDARWGYARHLVLIVALGIRDDG